MTSRTTCWVWRGDVNYLFAPHGLPIAGIDGQVIDRSCSCLRCLNPDHLEVVPHSEAIRRAIGRLQ